MAAREGSCRGAALMRGVEVKLAVIVAVGLAASAVRQPLQYVNFRD